MNEKYDEYREDICAMVPGCEKAVLQELEVKLPVSLKPAVRAGRPELECCGEPVVRCEECGCQKKEGCRLVIVQKVVVKIPVFYALDSDIREAEIECGAGCKA